MLFLTSIFDLKYLRLQTKYQKNFSVDFLSVILGLFLPIFSFLALKVWEVIEVTNRQTDIRQAFLPTQALLKNLKSSLTPLKRD